MSPITAASVSGLILPQYETSKSLPGRYASGTCERRQAVDVERSGQRSVSRDALTRLSDALA
jgi:hypothetical protein